MTPQPDLSLWPSKAEAAVLLGIGDRTLDRLIARQRSIEVRMRPRADGRKPEAVCNPEDIKRELDGRNRAVVVPAETPAAVALRAAPAPDLGRALEGVASIVRANRPAVEKLWLTLREASEYSGLSMALLQRLAHDGELTAVKDNGWKIRRAALAEYNRVRDALAEGGLVMWPGADVAHYKIHVEIGGLHSDVKRLKCRCATLEAATGITHVEED